MPVYHFHIVGPAVSIHDLEGSELPNLTAARLEAVKDARALMSDAILLGHDISGRRIEICTENGEVQLVVAFADTVKLHK